MADDLFQDTPPAFEGEEEDPAAEFLAREQDQLAGLDNGDDFDFNGASEEQAGGDQGTSQFDAFGDDEYQQQTEQNNQDQWDEQPYQNGGSSGYNAASGMSRLRIEPEKIRVWRENQQQMLEEKDEAEAKHIDEMKAAARKEIEDWYKHRDEQLEKTKETNRAAEEAYLKEVEDKEPGSEFERICRLCDFNPKNSKNTRDVSRFRSILLQLKQSGLIKNVQ